MVQFSGAEVMPVSVVPCWGRAEVLLVSASPCLCVLYAKLFALLGIVWVRARKSSPRKPKTGEKTLLLGVLGEFFRGSAAGGAVLGEFLSRDPVLRPGLVGGAAPPMSVAVGVLHYTKPSGGVPPACRTLMSCNSPRLAAVRPRLTAV